MNIPDLSKLGQQPSAEEAHLYDLQEFTPAEENQAKIIMAEVQRKYGGKEMTEANQLMLGNEVVDRFANELNLRVILTWAGVQVDDHSDDLHYIPQIDVVGRVAKHQVDHDAIKHQIQSGEADGKAYVLREDGTKREDTKSKDIF